MFLCASCIQQIISIAYWHWQKRFSSKCISSFEPENVIQVSYSSPQQLFCYKVCCKLICIFCLLIVKNSRVCLNKQITMLSIQQFSHTLSVVQIYQYGYIYRCVMENLVSFAIQPVITWNVICSECYRFTLVLGLVLFLCSA